MSDGDASMSRARLDRRASSDSWRLIFLGLLMISILWSPRIRVGQVSEKPFDLRFQDLLLALAFVVPNVLSFRILRDTKRGRLFGVWLEIYLLLLIVSALVPIATSQLSSLRVLAFFGRAVEPYLILIVTANIYGKLDLKFRMRFWWVTVAAVSGNLLWITAQLIRGRSGTLIGSQYEIFAYGPKLIGEPAPFSAGAFCCFALALGNALRQSGIRGNQMGVLLTIVVALVTLPIQSRAAIAAVVVMTFLYVQLPRRRKRIPSTLVSSGLGTVVFLSLLQTDLGQTSARFASQAVESSVSARVSVIWRDVGNWILLSPAIGWGPGSLGTSRFYATEAHNSLLRVAMDSGIPAAVAFLMAWLTFFRKAQIPRSMVSPNWEIRLTGTLCLGMIVASVVMGMFQDAVISVFLNHLLAVVAGTHVAARHSRP